MSPDDCPDYAPDWDLDMQYEDRFSCLGDAECNEHQLRQDNHPDWDRYAMPDETTEDYPGNDLDPADSGNYDALDESASDPETGTTYGDLT